MDASADLLKVNHRLESRVPEIGLLGSEGGATSSVVPTPIFRSRREESLGFGCPSVGVEGPVFNSQDADWLRRVHDVLQARQPQKISFVASLFREPATLQRKTQN